MEQDERLLDSLVKVLEVALSEDDAWIEEYEQATGKSVYEDTKKFTDLKKTG